MSWCASVPPTATRSVFPRPDVFDLRRANANQHLSFGSGPHLCLGASLARLEARVVLDELAAGLPGLRLRPGQTFDFMPIMPDPLAGRA